MGTSVRRTERASLSAFFVFSLASASAFSSASRSADCSASFDASFADIAANSFFSFSSGSFASASAAESFSFSARVARFFLTEGRSVRANVGVELKGVRSGVERRRGVSGIESEGWAERDAAGEQSP
jgi:hypothetical protein